MTIRRYGVLDADGTKINTILIDDETVTDYWPGYGAKLIDEGEEPQEPKAPPPAKRPDDFGVIEFALKAPLEVGDKIDFKSGEVMKAKPIAVDAEVAIVTDAIIEK